MDVQVMVLPGASPTTYEPKSRQMAAIAKAKIYFSIGVPFETVWLKRIVASNKSLRVVPMDRGIQKLAMVSHHSHDETEQHSEGGKHLYMMREIPGIMVRQILIYGCHHPW